MTGRVVELEAGTLEECRELVKSQMPPGFYVLSEQVVTDGTHTVKACAPTTEMAFAQARGEVPRGATVVVEHELSRPSQDLFNDAIEASDEQSAVVRAEQRHTKASEHSLPHTWEVRRVRMSEEGKRGFLGIVKKPNRYEVELLESVQAEVEITYKIPQKVKMAFTLAPINSPLHAAAAGGNVDDVQRLLRSGEDVNARNKWGETPLHLAAINDNPRVAELLIEHGADINAINESESETPLECARRLGHLRVAIVIVPNTTNNSELLLAKRKILSESIS